MKKMIVGILGVFIFSVFINAEVFSKSKFLPSKKLLSNHINTIHMDSQGAWIGTELGLHYISDGQVLKTYTGDYQTVKVNKLVEMKGNCFLINNTINDIESIGGKLYIGTDGGLSIFDTISGNWSSIDSMNSELGSNYIDCIEVEGNRLWIGTADKGLYIYDTKSGHLERKKGNPRDDVTGVMNALNITTLLYSEKNNELYVGTHDNGIYIYKSGVWRNINTKYPLKSRMPSNRVLSLEIFDGKLWIGTNQGLVSYSKGEFELYNEKSGIMSSVILTLEAGKENIYIGTAKGLYTIDKSNVISVINSDKKHRILSLKNLGNTLYMGTQNSGLITITVNE